MTKSKLVYFNKYVEEKFTIEGSGIRNSKQKAWRMLPAGSFCGSCSTNFLI